MGSNCFCPWKYFSYFRSNGATREWEKKSHNIIDVIQSIDSIPSNVQSANRETLLYVFEDNEAVIKMIMKGRSPTMRHVSRSHRIALDWLFDLDPEIQIQYIDTKKQLADILTKGNFTRDEWNHLFITTVLNLLKNERRTIDQGDLMKLLGEW